MLCWRPGPRACVSSVLLAQARKQAAVQHAAPSPFTSLCSGPSLQHEAVTIPVGIISDSRLEPLAEGDRAVDPQQAAAELAQLQQWLRDVRAQPWTVGEVSARKLAAACSASCAPHVWLGPRLCWP